MRLTLRLAALAALTLTLGLQGCDLDALGEALDHDDDAPTAREVLAQLGAAPETATLESAQVEATYLSAATGDPERRRLRAALLDQGCAGGEAAAYRSWSPLADVVVVEEAFTCAGQHDVALLTFLEPARPSAIASCWLSGGGDPEDQMVYAVASDGRILGTPRMLRLR